MPAAAVASISRCSAAPSSSPAATISGTPIGQQCHTFGLAQWIPITGIGAASLDEYSCRSGLGSHFSFAANYNSRSPSDWAAIARTVNEFRALQPLYSGDFYPLTPYSTAADTWTAWQFHRPDLNQGLVQAFRRPAAPSDTDRFPLSDLDQQSGYTITNLDDSTTQTISGHELATKGITIRLSRKPSAATFTYKKIKM